METDYVLHYPFKWLHGFDHEEFEVTSESNPDFRMELRKTEHGDSEIVVHGLPNYPVAKGCIFRCWFALLCLSALHHRPFEGELAIAETEPLEPELLPYLSKFFGTDLAGFDSKILGRVPYVRLATERVKRVRLTLTGRMQSEDLHPAEELMKWMWHPRYYELINDSKLRFSLELANLIGHDAPKESKFILIMSAIEALLPEEAYSESISTIVADWQKQLNIKLKAEADAALKEEIQMLLNQSAWLKQPSISHRFKKFAFHYLPHERVDQYRKNVKTAYNLRSNLVHTGGCDEEALTIVYPDVYGLLLRAIRSKLN